MTAKTYTADLATAECPVCNCNSYYYIMGGERHIGVRHFGCGYADTLHGSRVRRCGEDVGLVGMAAILGLIVGVSVLAVIVALIKAANSCALLGTC